MASRRKASPNSPLLDTALVYVSSVLWIYECISALTWHSLLQGKYTVRLAIQKRIALGMIAHPSLLQIPADLEALKKVTPEVPMLFITCSTDPQYPPEAQKTGDEILGNGSMEGEGYTRKFYDGCTHGFAVRGDKSDPKVKFGKEDAFKQTIDW
jgi:dienelactone hydrolase